MKNLLWLIVFAMFVSVTASSQDTVKVLMNLTFGSSSEEVKSILDKTEWTQVEYKNGIRYNNGFAIGQKYDALILNFTKNDKLYQIRLLYVYMDADSLLKRYKELREILDEQYGSGKRLEFIDTEGIPVFFTSWMDSDWSWGMSLEIDKRGLVVFKMQHKELFNKSKEE